MKVWGWDPSKTSGIAEWQTERDRSSIWCDIVRMPEECDPYQYSVQTTRKLVKLIKERGKPDIGVVEQQSLNSMGNNLEGVIYTWGGAQVFCGVMGLYGVPVVRIAPQSWHGPFFGQGFKPPQKIHKLKKPDPRTGKTEKVENLWKVAVVTACEDMGIVLPKPDSLAHNAADACALAICWHYAKAIDEEYHPQFMHLRQQRNTRAGGDLFGGAAA